MNERPLILLYKTPLGYYFYETGRNEIVSVNKSLYEYIEAQFSNENFDLDTFPEQTAVEYRELKELGYLAPPVVQTIQHPAINSLHDLLTRKLERVTLQVTQSCNLRCEYCIYSEKSNFAQRNHSSKVMTFDMAKEIIDFYFANSIDSENAAIAFYGGEPLLAFELIKKIVDYAETIFKGKTISYSITTNVTLLTEEKIDFLLSHHFNIMLSIDGPQNIQNKNRKFANGTGSYETVIRNVELFYKKDPNKMRNVTVHIVVDPETSYSEITKLFDVQALQNVKLSYAVVEKDSIVQALSAKYKTEYNYDFFLALVEYFRGEQMHYPSKIVEHDIDILKFSLGRFTKSICSSTMAPGGPCIPGKMKLFINCDGDFFPCEKVNENCAMKIGNIRTGFDYRQVSELLSIGQLTSEQCKKCWAFQFCTLCAKQCDENGTLTVEQKLKSCQSSKAAVYNKIIGKTIVFENEFHAKKMAKIMGGDKPYEQKTT